MTPRVSDESLVDATAKAIERYGWARVTVERIAELAGVSRVTLHRRGVTKHQLLGSLADRAAAEYRETMWPILTAPEGSAGSRLRQALCTICELAEANLNLLIALDAEANSAVFHDEQMDEALTRDAFTEPIERLLRDGHADGTLRDLDPPETATVLFNQVGWTYMHLRIRHRWRPGRAKDAVVGLALNGIANHDGPGL